MNVPDSPGAYPGVPFDVYRQIKAVNHSSLKRAEQSMAHVRWSLDGESNPATDSMMVGTALHVWLLERDLYADKVAIKPEFSGEGAKKRRAEWQEANKGKAWITEAGDEKVKAMGLAVSRHPSARRIAAASGEREVTLVWDDPIGVRCKARADKLIRPKLLVDIKTSESADFFRFRASIGRYCYHSGIAFYERGAKILGESDDIDGCLLVVESEPPHGVAVYELDGPAKSRGHQKIEEWLRQVKRCEETGSWPGYPDEVQLIGIPAWAQAKPGEEQGDGQGSDTEHVF